jgi:hypothetical protein
VAQENVWQEKGGLPDSTKVSTDRPHQHARRKNGRECTCACVARWKNCTEAKEGQYRIVGTGQSGRGEDQENGQRGSKSVTAAPWKSPIVAWSTFCDDYFRVADNPISTPRFDLGPRWMSALACTQQLRLRTSHSWRSNFSTGRNCSSAASERGARISAPPEQPRRKVRCVKSD